MKKNNITTIILLLLLVVGGWFAYTLITEDESADRPFSDFRIEDTASVTRLVLADTEGGAISITRRNPEKKWMIEGTSLQARPESANLILETFFRLAVKEDVPKAAQANVLSLLSVKHRKIEVYNNEESKPFKTYYVGQATADHFGSYMLLQKGNKKSNVPYIVHKQGTYAYLDSRFFTDTTEWRFTGVYTYRPKDIKKVTIRNFETPSLSYSIDVYEDGNVGLFNELGQPVAGFDSTSVKRYLSYYSNLHIESFNTVFPKSILDSIKGTTPAYEIIVETRSGDKNPTRLFRVRGKDIAVDINGDTVKWDRERALIQLKSGDMAVVQYFSWGDAIRPPRYFMPFKNKHLMPDPETKRGY
jgi:hypothetical protein